MLHIVTRMEVRYMLSRVKKGTAPGTQGIHYDLLCHGGNLVEDTHLLLYSLVWSTGTSPDEWLKALIQPIYKPKTKDPSVIEHYRAVTLFKGSILGPMARATLTVSEGVKPTVNQKKRLPVPGLVA